jgi:thioredoxin reductase
MLAQIYTVIIVRAGPGGLSAAARVHANHLDYLLFDKEELGNTLSQRRGSKLGSQPGAIYHTKEHARSGACCRCSI